MPSPEEQLTRALRVAAEPETALSAPGEALLAAARRRDRVRRTLAPAAAAAAVVLLAAGVTVELHPGRAAQVPAGGGRAQRWTVVAHVNQRDHGPLVACANEFQSLPPGCDGPVVVGADPADLPPDASVLANPRSFPAGTTYTVSLRLTGTYDAASNTLRLTERPVPAEPTGPPVIALARACPSPTGTVDDEAGRARLAGYVAGQPDGAGVYVDATQKVMTAQFTGDLPRHEREIRAVYAGPLCLVKAEVAERDLKALLDRASRDLPQLGFHLLGSDVDAIGQHAGISVVAATTQQVRQLQDRYGVALQVGSYLTPLQPEAPSGLPPAPAGARTAVDGLFLVDARTLRVELPVGGGCDTTGTAAAVAQESPARIVLRGTVRGRTRPHGVRVCNKMLLVQAIVVRLSAPLGTREVVDGLTGRILRRG